jgi:D-glycero-D-manno-heptose 1,7-bisphosphate phosphatase
LSGRAVFLDRDGVIVELVWDVVDQAFESPNAKADVALVPGAAEAIRRIKALDYQTVVVSNQAAVAKQKASRADVCDAHARVVSLLADAGTVIDDYRYCLHHPDGRDPVLAVSCDCRKPKPGLLFEAAAEMAIDLSGSWMIGDSDVDIEAGKRAGCQTILIENPHSIHRRRKDTRPDHRVADICKAAAIIDPEGR